MKKDIMKEIIEWIGCILIAVILALIVRYFIITPTIVQQSSMFPTLKADERLVLNRIARGNIPNRGEIITLEAPKKNTNINVNNPVATYDEFSQNIISKFMYYILEIGKTSYIKRVIGLPGEHVKIENGQVYINGEELEENYLQNGVMTPAGRMNDIIVPSGYIFVLGDNRQNSTDSREFGCIPISKIEGKAIFRFWPFNRWGKI